jgi:predicted 2-oxoglutarate/Fe(II)-dependent dioxygenase YbiX
MISWFSKIAFSNATCDRYTEDNSDVSFILLLSDPSKDFEGGGTYFYDLNENLHLRQGDALVFNGQLVHEAAHITKGLRYVIAGFTLFDQNWLKMKRLGTLATMTTLQR